jgi:hypothetical protein
MTFVDHPGGISAGALRYFVFIVCICAFLFVFLLVRLATGLSPEIYYDPPAAKTVYRAQLGFPRTGQLLVAAAVDRFDLDTTLGRL